MIPQTSVLTKDQPETNHLFRSAASLNPFHKKSPPPRSPPPSTEPYEVFPGTWSTDATAKVFGYVEPDQPSPPETTDESHVKPPKSKRRINLRSSALVKKLIYRYREVHIDDGTDDFSGRTHRLHVEARDRRRQQRRDETEKERETSQESTLRARRDDDFIQRGANLRTGRVSPGLVTDDGEEGVEYGQIDGKPHKQAEKWKQNKLGWSFAESPTTDSSTEDLRNELDRAALAEHLQDRFVVDMPGVDNADPVQLTMLEIQQYQKMFRDMRIFDKARLRLPERSENRVQNVPRKEVGSGSVQKDGSRDTAIVQDQIRASSISTPREGNTRDRRARLLIPPSTPTRSSPRCSLYDRHDVNSGSGLYSENLPSQTTDSIKPLCCLKKHPGADQLPEIKVPINPTPPTMNEFDDGVKVPGETSAAASCPCSSLIARNVTIARKPLPRKAACAQVNGNIINPSTGVSGAKLRITSRTKTQTTGKLPIKNLDGLPKFGTTCCEYRVGLTVKGVDDDKHEKLNKQTSHGGLVHEASNFGGLWGLVESVEQKFYGAIRMRSIHRRILEMIHHVLLTLNPSSPALTVLRLPNAKMEEYLAALTDVIRAIIYLLVLLNIAVALGKFLRLPAVAITLFRLPLKLVLWTVRRLINI
ncbi:hypothetical protein MMC07_003421 [Pseudocyphellaria aurata]|nr:hypothetical protein [Pseudocyphellaria aurata]